MPKIKIHAEHSKVSTLGRFKQGKIFASKPMPKSFSKRVVQRIKDTVRSRKELGLIVVRKQHKDGTKLPSTYSAAMSLANLLFPKNFPKIIATGLREPGYPHSSVTYSQLVPLTKESQRGIESYYKDIRLKRNSNTKETRYHKYSVANKNSIRKVAKQIEESGLVINDKIMNVGIRKDAVGKEFVFFEVDGINLPQIKTYIEKLPQKTSSQRLLKTQAEQLFKFIMSQEVNGIRANTHIHPKNRSFIG